MASKSRNPAGRATGNDAAFARERPRVPRTPDFSRVNAAALACLPDILARWLPGGRRRGAEYIALNPTRRDRRPGSFSINLTTGRWADFAAGDTGVDVVSLAAYLHGLGQADAARRLAAMLGVEANRG